MDVSIAPVLPAVLQVDRHDTVAVALRDIGAGEIVPVGGSEIAVRNAVPKGHKLAIAAHHAGDPVVKYGFSIGHATMDIAVGDHVHSHNVATSLSGEDSYRYQPVPAPVREAAAPAQFSGFVRADGRVGTRNEIWVLPTVGCVARTAQKIAARAAGRLHGSVEGVHAFGHPHGCSQLGDDLGGTRAILAALASHPNAGGVLILGLGCESNQIDELLALVPEAQRGRIRTLRAQGAGDEIEAGLALVDDLIAEAGRAQREVVGLDRLVVGLKCGGSDAFSGLTANPLVGKIADRVTGAGGSAVLTEIPEVFGAETLLMARARDEATFDGIVTMVNDFKRYFLAHGEPVSENPSPGNIAGGITTLEEKSLGAVQKGGHAQVGDVIGYGASVRRTGLTLLDAPGNDAVSSTALAAAGATVILFTTGRGTPLGFPVPTIKVASNSALAAAKPGWIDFDAGSVLADGLAGATDAFLDRILAVASGATTAAERNEEREIAIWKRGVTL
ncbi:UxaA family hydrolase [Polymorphobacter fuscus]|uniref:Altronate dehydratase n=1 Tax=Sandarakinorhabdus fusca TaxID=1439888 RepID=A0A7C9KKD3_9SPHN|nr:altronate dehydratase family protein [Polymorphobacter fuscus]KAB7643635.1 altronate dehydratase [Polymorphobacter fuscus]MQT18719.1 altronate dehydratase [Polymorphobacter fuscus]NJC09609.1 altronate hydrolase [Polymorphobacter fuscus]